MKKYASLIALAVVVVLAIVVATTGKAPDETVSAPYSVEAVDNLTRIELVEAGEDGELVVLEKSEDGWRITKPFDAALNDQAAAQLAEAAGKKINTDDIALNAENLEDFGLSDSTATKVSLFSATSEAPTAEFYLGKSMSVPGTNAKRTYLKTTDGKVYRAQTNLGTILGQPVGDLRSKSIARVDRNEVSKIDLEHADGTKVTLTKAGDAWASSQLDFELERTATSGLVSTLANLNATGFVDGKTAAEVGLEPPHVLVRASSAQGELTTVLLSAPQDGKVFVKTGGAPQIYEITEAIANRIALTPLTLRSLTVKPLPDTDVARIDFAGSDRVSVERDGDGWKFARGGKGNVKSTAVATHLGALANLRAVRFEHPAGETGLARGERVVVTMKDGARHTLTLGSDADDHGNVWGQWSDSDLIMVLPSWIRERVAPTAASLTEEAS